VTAIVCQTLKLIQHGGNKCCIPHTLGILQALHSSCGSLSWTTVKKLTCFCYIASSLWKGAGLTLQIRPRCNVRTERMQGSVAYRRGVWGAQPPPLKFGRPSKIMSNSTRLWKLLKIAEFRTPTHKDVWKKGSKILKLPPVRSCFTLAMTNKLVVVINSLEVPQIKKVFTIWNEISCTKLQLPSKPLSKGLPPPDPRSLCPVSSTEFVETPSPRTKFLGMPLVRELKMSKPSVLGHTWNEQANVRDGSFVGQAARFLCVQLPCVLTHGIYTYEGESNGNLKSAIKIRNTARSACKLTATILVVWRVADRWQYDAGMQHDGAVVV